MYTYNFLYKNNSNLTISAIILAVFGGIGTVRTLVLSVINWHKTPKLNLGEIHPEYRHFDKFTNTIYFLTVSKERGHDVKAKDCEAWLDIKNKHYPTVWAPNDTQLCDIGDYLYLRLFEVKPKYQIIFPQGYPKQGFKEIAESYDDYINSPLKVTVHSTNAGSKGERNHKRIIFLQNLIKNLNTIVCNLFTTILFFYSVQKKNRSILPMLGHDP